MLTLKFRITIIIILPTDRPDITFPTARTTKKLSCLFLKTIISTPCNQLTSCNFRAKGKCPMNGQGQTKDAIYECLVTSF